MDQQTCRVVLEEVTADLQRHRDEVARLELLANYLAAKVRQVEPAVSGGNGTGDEDDGDVDSESNDGDESIRPASRRGLPDLRGLSQVDAAQVVLREHRKPCHTAEIAQELHARGFNHISFPALRKALFSALQRREDLFRRVRPGVWDLSHASRNSDN